MDYLRFALVAVNAVAFVALTILTVRLGRREKYAWVRRLWIIIALACGALVLGSFQRVALQGVSVGWLPESVGEVVTGDLQIAQSLVVLFLVLLAFVTLRKQAASVPSGDVVYG